MIKSLIDRLEEYRRLDRDEYVALISCGGDDAEYLRARAETVRRRVYGNSVYIRGLIEISNICRNDCYYCGIRRSNTRCSRYRLTEEEILSCCRKGWELGFRTFVLQGGEDPHFTDGRLESLIGEIKRRWPHCAVTLSLGERSRESYRRLKAAGADRYLLRHETATAEHYAKLHPEELTLKNRLECLENLRDAGFQVGCGFMVGSPYQTPQHIAADLKFISDFKPDMCGVGPFIPHGDTPFGEFPAGSADLTCKLLSMIRLIHPTVLLPATTALGTVSGDGRERGMLAGANVVMPNLSPESARHKYELYKGKLHSGSEAAENLAELKGRMENIGYRVVADVGNVKKEEI